MGAGERFKARRETLGQALDAVSAELRISSKYLRGIEEGNYEGFPARVFSVGFIKSYAAYLGESPEPVIQEYAGVAGDPLGPDSHNPVTVSPQWVEKARERGHRMTYYLLAAFVVLLIGSGLSWYASRSYRQPPAQKAADNTPVPVPNPGAAVADNQAPRSAKPADDNAAPAPAVAPGPVQDNAALSVSAAILPPYQLYLEAIDQTWLMYSLDGDEPLDTMLYPGDKLSIQASRKIYMKLGNAGGVVGTLNGHRMPPFGGRGQVRVVTMGK